MQGMKVLKKQLKIISLEVRNNNKLEDSCSYLKGLRQLRWRMILLMRKFNVDFE